MTDEEEIDLLLQKWGLENLIYDFMEYEVNQIVQKYFSGKLSRPKLQIVPSSFSRGLFHEANAAARYSDEEGGRPACIDVYIKTLFDKDFTIRVLIHEMVHHWERTIQTDDQWSYPEEIDIIIRKRYKNRTKEHSWRNKHSPRFVAKTLEISKQIGILPSHLLFGK